ncbi:MAG: hypothetical protein ACK48W_09430 [Bacteroidota bacterium]|jgi:hypothetical protein
MRDPRIVLKDELIAIGILSKQASNIAPTSLVANIGGLVGEIWPKPN